MSVIQAFAQPSMSVLKVNNLYVRLNSNGQISDSVGAASVTTNSGLSLLSNAGVWMSAKDSAGNIRVAAHSSLINAHEFWSGPLELKNETPSSQSTWNKVYPISKAEVQNHRQNYSGSGYIPSVSISGWPGSLGFPYAQVMAPFVDYKVNNQIYEPMNGDYPYLVSDAMIYSIANDRYSSTHTYSKGLPLGVELHTSVMGFHGEPALENCVLVRYSVYNRSDRDYSNFRLSSVLNFTIGTIKNDFLGTEIQNKTLYALNDTTEATFSGRLVSIGCMAINRNISSTMYFENSTDPINGQPDSAMHFYNLMQGKWKNGKALNFGSNGVDGTGSARYVYPDTTDNLNGNTRWTDQVPGHKIGILNFDSAELKRGTAANYEILLFFVETNNYNFKQIGQSCLTIQNALKQKNLLKIDEGNAVEKFQFPVYPNPAKIGDKLNLEFPLETTGVVRLISMEGKEICKLNLDTNAKSIILPADLKPGVYVLEYQTLNTKVTQKLILNH